MSNDRIKKVTSSTGTLPPTLLDLTQDTVTQSNLQKDETAHNNEGYPITGQMAIEDAEAWAVGTKNGVPVSEEDIQFNNNSKYYAAVSGSIMRIAGQQALAAATSANNAAESAEASAENAVISGSYMRIAGEYKDEAAASAERAEDSEAWAVGKRDGTDVPPSDPTYHNNSKYWADQAKAYGTGGVHYIASVLFENIPVSGMASGDMYNIEDDFTTDERFQEGAGIQVKAGTNIIYNAYGKWDVEATGGGNDDLIANTENGNTATHAYIKGQQFIKEDKLYKAVKDIAVGDVLAPATPVNPVSFTLEQADYITKMRVYSSATDYIDYFPSGRRLENITLYTNQRVVLYHSASSKWGYIFVNPYRYIDLEVGETSYFIVPNNATGDSATIMQRAEESATGISVDNFTIGESAFLGTYGWVKDVTGLVMGEGSPIENGNYIPCDNITDQIQIFKGVNGSIASVSGLVPPAQEEGKFFRSDGNWANLNDTMELQTINGSISRIGGEIENLSDSVGNITELDTTAKDSTVAAINEVKAETTAIAKNIEAVVNVYGSKNLLPNNAETQTYKGITYTVNSDGSFSMSGTASSNGGITLASNIPIKKGTYIFSNNAPITKDFGLYLTLDGVYYGLTSAGYERIIEVSNDTTFSATTWANSGHSTYSVFNGETYYPMIRDARISDDAYVPYAMTNRELTENVTEQFNAVNAKVGELSNLDTTDKSNIVAAINELKGDAETTLLSRRKIVLPWGTYESSSSSTATEVTLSRPIISGSLLELTFGVSGRYRFMISAPGNYSESGTEYNDFVLLPGTIPHTTRIYWRSNNKIAIITATTDGNYALRSIAMFV